MNEKRKQKYLIGVVPVARACFMIFLKESQFLGIFSPPLKCYSLLQPQRASWIRRYPLTQEPSIFCVITVEPPVSGNFAVRKFENPNGNAEQRQTSSTKRNVISSDSQHEEVERKISAVADTGRHLFSASISVHMTFLFLK